MAALLDRKEFEDRIVLGHRGEGARGRAGEHGEVALHGGREAIEIFFQNFEFVAIPDGAELKGLPRDAFLQSNFSAAFRVADPLRAATRGNEEALPAEIEQIDGCGVDASGSAAADLQQVIVAQAEAESDQDSKRPVENPPDNVWRPESGHLRIRGHNSIVRPTCMRREGTAKSAGRGNSAERALPEAESKRIVRQPVGGRLEQSDE